jgi:hypothetical protein
VALADLTFAGDSQPGRIVSAYRWQGRTPSAALVRAYRLVRQRGATTASP